MAFEADPGDDPGAESCNPVTDLTGTRTIMWWDGQNTEPTPIYTSPAGVWHGRPELNSAGVVAWEGYGCIKDFCSSGDDDAEIFVYDPQVGEVVQLTDDDDVDKWPEVTPSGTIVWHGQGTVEGHAAPSWDWEVFIAYPNPQWELCVQSPFPVLSILPGLGVSDCN